MRSLVCAIALVLAGCSSRVGPDGLAVGGPCIDEFDCVAGSFCLNRPDFPNGTCTTNCEHVADCRGDSLCVDLEAGVCLLPCTTDPDCGREGYVCREMVLRGEIDEGAVCVGR